MTSASPNARRKSFSTFTPVSVRSAEGVTLENVTEAAGSCLPILPLNARAVLPVSLYAEVSRLHLLPVKSFAANAALSVCVMVASASMWPPGTLMRTGVGFPLESNGRFDQSIQQNLSAYGPVAPSPDCLQSRTVRPPVSSAVVVTAPVVSDAALAVPASPAPNVDAATRPAMSLVRNPIFFSCPFLICSFAMPRHRRTRGWPCGRRTRGRRTRP